MEALRRLGAKSVVVVEGPGHQRDTQLVLYLRLQNRITPPIPMAELLVLGLVLGPLLEESLFRGCILPVLAQAAGTIPAIIITAVYVSVVSWANRPGALGAFTGTGIAYVWHQLHDRTRSHACRLQPHLMSLFLFFWLEG